MNVRVNLKSCLVIAMFLMAMACPVAVGQIIYVDADANGANDGSSWANAYNYLQDAFADANSNGDVNEIWVAEGIYKPDQGAGITPGDRTATFQLANGVTLKGGYAGFGEPDPNARDIELYETILSGDLAGNDVQVNEPYDLLTEPTRSENSYHVVTGSGTDETAILDGFTITAGNANGPRQDRYNRGGGMYQDSYSSPTVTNCTFSANSATAYGGGMYSYWDRGLTLTNCNFSQNWAVVGGGMSSSRSSSTLTNCTFSGNSAEYGGGMSNEDGSPTLTNCTFSGNLASIGGGMDNFMSSPTLTNCTFSGNSAEYGGGMYFFLECTLTATNCILWENMAAQGNDIYLSNDPHYMSTATIRYSNIKGGIAEVFVGAGYTLNWAKGNIDADPLFVDANNGNYHLKSEGWRWDTNRKVWTWDNVTSPCIDAGNPGSPLGDELMSVPDDPNNEWGENLRINMGAYGGTAEASMAPPGWALLGDLTNDRRIDFNDLAVFVEYWLESGQCIPGDFNRNESVDFSDFSLMALQWLRDENW